MVVAQLGSSSWKAWLLLAAYLPAAVLFGWLALRHRDAVAGVLCLAAAAGAIRVGIVVWRRIRWRARGAEVVAARSGTVAAHGRLFVGFARHIVGASTQKGMLVLSPTRAAFVPVGRRMNLLLETFVSVFVARFRFVDFELDLPMGGDVDAALEGPVAQRGGFFLDSACTYAPLQRLLTRPSEGDALWLAQAPPTHLMSRWPETRGPTAAVFRTRRARVLQVGIPIVATLQLGGAVAWRWTGNADYMIAGTFWAVAVGGALAAALILAGRRIAQHTGGGAEPR